MPRVGNREFAYTAAGIRQAMKAAKNMKRRPTSGRPLPRPLPGTMRPRVPNKTMNQLNSAIQRRSLVASLQKIRGNAQPNRKEYQGPVSLTPRPSRVMRPAPGSGNPNIPDRGPNRVPTANPNIPDRGPVKNNPLIPDRRQPSGTRRVQRPRPLNLRFPRN